MNIHAHAALTRSAILLCFFSVFSAYATSVALPYNFTAGSPISASQMMGNFASITSAISSTVSSPWVASSSNIYFNAGSVGIGSSAPARALDVNGSVSVSGSVNVNGNITCNNGKYLQSGNGYAALPGGVLLQWGQVTVNVNSGQVYTSFSFPTAFSNTPYSVTGTVTDANPGYGNFGAGNSIGLAMYATSASTFVCGIKSAAASSATISINWIAVGPS